LKAALLIQQTSELKVQKARKFKKFSCFFFFGRREGQRAWG
jgi:hypothetical protein